MRKYLRSGDEVKSQNKPKMEPVRRGKDTSKVSIIYIYSDRIKRTTINNVDGAFLYPSFYR